MKKILLLISTLIFLGCSNSALKTFQPIKEYKIDEYKLKKGVEYLEIREYIQSPSQSKYDIENYGTIITMQSKPLESFSPKLMKAFKKIKPNLGKESNIRSSRFCLMRGCTSRISNGFMIDSNNKIWVLNEVKDILEMIGEVDTPAEVNLVLWLNDKHRSISDKNYKDKYRKTSEGYTIISQYDNSISNSGECGLFTYEIDIAKNGEMTKKKLLKKEASKHGCLAID